MKVTIEGQPLEIRRALLLAKDGTQLGEVKMTSESEAIQVKVCKVGFADGLLLELENGRSIPCSLTLDYGTVTPGDVVTVKTVSHWPSP